MITLVINTSEVVACQTFVHQLGNDEQIVMDLELLQIFNKGTLMCGTGENYYGQQSLFMMIIATMGASIINTIFP